MYWPTKSSIALALLLSGAVSGAELNRETARAWEEYLARANARMMDRTHSHHFLWTDESKERLQRVRSGEIVIAPIQPKMPVTVPHGLVHHWIGAVFFPGAHVQDVIAKTREYEHYREFYAPAVREVQVMERDSNPDRGCDRFVVTMVNQSFFSKRALESEYRSNYVALDAHRSYSLTQSVRVQEWFDYGSSKQHKLPPGEGSGYVWKVSTITRLEERDGGVYFELEAIALSRDVPAMLHFLVDPIIRHVSRSTLLTSLDQTRKAVETKAETSSVTASGTQ
ncbi:MAG TPA: hypothetical protein VE621_08865 [Bryobacteraceae bacterium]|nr:hypothetical protein [Bryobacteraceae bacterium]